jgi:urease subunit alpha
VGIRRRRCTANRCLPDERRPTCVTTGTTTLIGGSPGPAFEVGSGSTRNLGLFLRGGEHSAMNFVAFGRGSSDAAAVLESVAAGAGAVKIHEDFGASQAVIDATLRAADSADFAVHLHTDSINEFGFAEKTLATIGDRTIHMYHVEGAGGGHAPDLIQCVGYDNVIPASTNPTNPYTPFALEEGVPMTMEAHNMNWDVPEDVAFAEARIRPQTMIAEDFLHDMGAISIFGSDTQGMGRVAENIANCCNSLTS